MLSIRFWDMDHTLIENDCDVSWKTFMIRKGLAPADAMDEADRFFELYNQARLPIEEFLGFQLAEFKGRTLAEMRALCQEHFETIVKPVIYRDAQELVRAQLAAGEHLCLLTATNRYIAEPVAAHLGFPELLASELELQDGVFTGRPDGIYCGGAGKLNHAGDYCTRHGTSLEHAWYYGDSATDIPALHGVGHPVAVNPAARLREEAEAHQWPILEWQS